ncbi:MAG TPA: phosphoenolpyruvate synthase [Candidatus Paceibacterota bacterium]|jgi:pyruvate,water dikinase|nr:phosphoenolpyruvate synthase [Candidatus Paceibacterota bacterium]
MRKDIIWFEDLTINDVNLVGGKNAALGEMYSELLKVGIKIPNGFAITAQAYKYFLKFNEFDKKIEDILKGLNTHNTRDLALRGKKIRELIKSGVMPKDLEEKIKNEYQKLSNFYKTKNVDVAVRSSATAEDLPDASFAGQQETYLNIRGEQALIEAVKNSFSSLFTDRAISYRYDKGFSSTEVLLSVGVQKMVRSDKGSSGVAFTIDTETGFNKVILINGSYGLGELVVKGQVTPDEFVVFKPSLENNFYPIISKNIGKKEIKMIYSRNSQRVQQTEVIKTSISEQQNFCLTDEEIIKLSWDCLKIEKHFSKKHKRYSPMDIEWAKDGITGEMFIVQARPETVQALKNPNIYEEYILKQKGKLLVTGIAIGAKISAGKVRVIKDVKQISEFRKGEILVTEVTDPDWEPIMKIASGIITDKGGRTSHAAIVSRELGVNCIVGANDATSVLKTGQMITIDCSSGTIGNVYEGRLNFEVKKHELKKLKDPKVKISINIGSPDEAFKYHNLPVKGVGLGRLEFIIASQIQIHPNVLIDYPRIKNGALKFNNQTKKDLESLINKIDQLTIGYSNKQDFYVDKLTFGIAKIAAAFWPNEVIIRFSDFKTNEYATLTGGNLYEPFEENPMIGWRGASRYYHPNFEKAFGLECQALKNVREKMGFINVVPMVPFCRTIEEAQKVLKIMAKYGLKRGQLVKNSKESTLKVYVMAEIPSNAILAKDFLKYFDGMSIGSNDLTQLVLGIDRDSTIISGIGNENNQAVKETIKDIIKECRKQKKYSGICGQAPSDFPQFAKFLQQIGIEAISLNPDSIIKTIIALTN